MLNPDGTQYPRRYAYAGAPPQQNSSVKLNASVQGNSETVPKECGPRRVAATDGRSSTTNLLICFILGSSGQRALLGAGRFLSGGGTNLSIHDSRIVRGVSRYFELLDFLPKYSTATKTAIMAAPNTAATRVCSGDRPRSKRNAKDSAVTAAKATDVRKAPTILLFVFILQICASGLRDQAQLVGMRAGLPKFRGPRLNGGHARNRTSHAA